jgi:hypothetical protein
MVIEIDGRRGWAWKVIYRGSRALRSGGKFG